MPLLISVFFFFNDTATTEIYTLSLHDALPICGPPKDRSAWRIRDETRRMRPGPAGSPTTPRSGSTIGAPAPSCRSRSEEHTSELQSQSNLVCRLLLEKKKNTGRHYAESGRNEY